MPPETRTCKNCNAVFSLEQDDFDFYQKMKVAAPRVCPDCQLQRRLAYRNERSLYSRKESKDGKSIISIFSPEKLMPVYTQDTWWGDSWDPMTYGREYDFSRPFFEQFTELILHTPWPALFNLNATNSEYCNYTTDNKNCYLVFGGDYNENCAYASFNMNTKDSMEMYFVTKSELCYEVSDSQDCYRVAFSQYATNCSDCMFLYACNNCTNCLGCINLKNKQYCILNEQYSKDGYENKIKELNLDVRENLEAFAKKFEELKLRQPYKYASISKSEHSTGDNLSQTKNCTRCFETYEGAEDCKNLFLAGWNLKDSRNTSTSGHGSQLLYDSLGVFGGCSSIRHSYFVAGCLDLWYSIMCKSSNNLFGCFGLRHKSFCILNRQYTEIEYNDMIVRIIEQMSTTPFQGRDGYTYTFGDYFPIECSPFAYNESVAQSYFPLTKDQAVQRGYAWRDEDHQEKTVSIQGKDLPSNIREVDDSILSATIGCEHNGTCLEQCTRAYRIIPRELEFYRRLNLPIPRLCPNCRHYQRMKRRNPIKLWPRPCMCVGPQSIRNMYTNQVSHSHANAPCSATFETTFSPDRQEIVYCEECYRSEVH